MVQRIFFVLGIVAASYFVKIYFFPNSNVLGIFDNKYCFNGACFNFESNSPNQGNLAALNFPMDHGPHKDSYNESYIIHLDLNLSKNLKSNLPTNKAGSSNPAYYNKTKIISTVTFNTTRDRNQVYDSMLVSSINSAVNTFAYSNLTGIFTNQINNGKLNTRFLPVDGSYNSSISFYESKDKSSNLTQMILIGEIPNVGFVNLVFLQPNQNHILPWGDLRCNGIISVFNSNDTYIYSIPNYVVAGYVLINGYEYTVDGGLASLDHTWSRGNEVNSFFNLSKNYWVRANFSTNNNTKFDDLKYKDLASGRLYSFSAFSNDKYSYYAFKDSSGNNNCGKGVRIAPVNYYSDTLFPANLNVSFGDQNFEFTTRRKDEVMSIYGNKFVVSAANVKLNRNQNGAGYIITGKTK